MKIKIDGGTAKSGNLCDGCKFSKQTTYQNGKKIGFCGAMNMGNGYYPLLQDVAECNLYEERGQMPLWELKSIAWLIEISKSRKIGFVSPIDRSKKQNEEVENL